MKNCEPFVFGPALAIERSPGLVCLTRNDSSWTTSSARQPGEQVQARFAQTTHLKLLAVNRFSTRAIAGCEVATCEEGQG